MESKYRQLAELLADFEGPFWTEYERQIHERGRLCLRLLERRRPAPHVVADSGEPSTSIHCR